MDGSKKGMKERVKFPTSSFFFLDSNFRGRKKFLDPPGSMMLVNRGAFTTWRQKPPRFLFFLPSFSLDAISINSIFLPADYRRESGHGSGETVPRNIETVTLIMISVGKKEGKKGSRLRNWTDYVQDEFLSCFSFDFYR